MSKDNKSSMFKAYLVAQEMMSIVKKLKMNEIIKKRDEENNKY